MRLAALEADAVFLIRGRVCRPGWRDVDLRWQGRFPGIMRLRVLGAFLLLAFLSCSAHPSANQAGGRLLITSDLHFNPFADATLVGDLIAAEPAGWEAILNRSALTGYSPYAQDTNWPLLRSALDAMHSTEPDPALVMITGDFLAHGFPQKYQKITQDNDRAHYRAFVLKTVEFIALEVRERFKATEVLITPGNNDDECGDYDIAADGPFLSDTAALARDLAHADDQFSHDWKALGSYAVPHPSARRVRIVSLNTVFFSNKYLASSFQRACATVDSDAADRTLKWLESELSNAKKAHEKVWLMFHIPPGIDGYATMMQYAKLLLSPGTQPEDLCAKAIVPMWKPEWTSKFDALLEEYHDTIEAVFAGHTHTDDFRVIGADGAPTTFILIDPPVSPIYYQNPAFRVVTFLTNGEILDQSTYFLTNLEAASKSTPGIWALEYRFSEQWHQKRMAASGLGALDHRIQDDPETRSQWLKLYNVSSTAVHVPAEGVPFLSCAIGSLDPASYQKCYCPVREGPGKSDGKP